MKKINYKNFAKALYEIGRENNLVDNLIKDLEDVEEKLDDNIELRRFLSDQHVSADAKQQALEKVFADFISEKTYNFLHLLIKNRALDYLDQIIEEIKKAKHEKENIVEVVAISPEAIDAATQQRISRILSLKTDKKIIIKSLIDKSLIGGLVIKIGDTVIDGSIRGKINRLKSKIKQIS
jgi:F-type H+-transporting ATPase subunit delta